MSEARAFWLDCAARTVFVLATFGTLKAFEGESLQVGVASLIFWVSLEVYVGFRSWLETRTQK